MNAVVSLRGAFFATKQSPRRLMEIALGRNCPRNNKVTSRSAFATEYSWPMGRPCYALWWLPRQNQGLTDMHQGGIEVRL
jgi:hypothetical protein